MYTNTMYLHAMHTTAGALTFGVKNARAKSSNLMLKTKCLLFNWNVGSDFFFFGAVGDG